MLPALNVIEERVVRFIERSLLDHQRTPSFEEIAKAAALSSKDFVWRVVNSLERKGYVARQPGRRRALQLLRRVDGSPFRLSEIIDVPVLGRIAAGLPLAVADNDFASFGSETIALTRDIVRDQPDVYALHVQGTSMVDALIGDGDVVIMKYQDTADNGDMVAVWLKEEKATTLKHFYLEQPGEKSKQPRVRLQPANPTMPALYYDPEQIEIQGKVLVVIRHLA